MTPALRESKSLLTDEDSWSEATFVYTVASFSKVGSKVLSPPRMIRNLPWRMMIMPHTSNKNYPMQKSLNFYLMCGGDVKDSSWSCPVKAFFTIVSQVKGINDFTRSTRHSFSSTVPGWGFTNFMMWDDLMNPEKGFIKNDFVIFQVKVEADIPDEITENGQKYTDDVDSKIDKKSISQDLSTKTIYQVADPNDYIAKDCIPIEVLVSDYKAAVENHDNDRVECLLILIRARISVLQSLPVNYVTEWTKEQLRDALKWVETEAKNAQDFLGSSKNTFADSPSSASSCTVRIDWKPVPFYGKKDEWCQWWKTFETVVHTNQAADDKMKMKVLTQCLRSKANDILGDMQRTGENYRRAIALLQNQYGDALTLSQTYYKQLEYLTPAHRDLKSQRETVNKLRSIIQNLDDLREKIPIDDQAITCNIIEKFPDAVLRLALNSLNTSGQETVFHPKPAELLVALERCLQVEQFITAHKRAKERSRDRDHEAFGG